MTQQHAHASISRPNTHSADNHTGGTLEDAQTANLEQAQTWLEQILAWLPTMRTPSPQIRSPRIDSGPHGHTDALPFHLDQTLDDIRVPHAKGIRTPAGVRRTLWFWAVMAGAHLHIQQPTPGACGAWLLTELPLLTVGWKWWGELAQTLHTLHRLVSKTTGHGSLPVGMCPACHVGTVRVEITDTGLTGDCWCPNCDRRYSLSSNELTWATKQELRRTDIDPDVTVTREDITAIWGNHITNGNLRLWRFRGQLHKCVGAREETYQLRTINTLARRKTQHAEKAA